MSEENNIEKLNWQRLAITVGIVLVTAAAVGGTIWYLMDQSSKDVADSNMKSIAALQKQIDEVNTRVKAGTATTNTATSGNNPVIAWSSAGEFTPTEKATITSKVIEPYLYYENVSGKKVASVLIIEIPEGNKGPQISSYTIHTVSESGYNGGWVFGENDVVDYWKPVCGLIAPAIAEFGKCPNGYDEFKVKYPNNWSV
jgi:hypothetical protein